MDNHFSNAERAEVLTQALPYIKKHTNKIVVIKYGGNAMINEQLKQQVMEVLWNESDGFFETVTLEGASVGVRELIGYVPWAYNLPYDEEKYAAAFAQLLDPQGFLATYGPTTVEQRNAGFLKTVFGAGCRWDGPSWPFATSQTLMAAANLLNYYNQNKVFDNGDWYGGIDQGDQHLPCR